MSEASARKLSDDLLRPLLETSWRFYVLVAFLGAIDIRPSRRVQHKLRLRIKRRR